MRHGRGIDGHRIYEIEKDLHKLEQETVSVEMYYHKLKGLWDEYSALEIASKAQDEQEQRRKLMQLLMGLHDSFATARGQILMMDPLPTVTHAYSLIRETCFKLNGYPKGHPLAIYNKPKPPFNNSPNASQNKKGNQFY